MACNCLKKDPAIKRHSDDGQGGFYEARGMRKVLRIAGNLALLVIAGSGVVALLPLIIVFFLFRGIISAEGNAISVKMLGKYKRKIVSKL